MYIYTLEVLGPHWVTRYHMITHSNTQHLDMPWHTPYVYAMINTKMKSIFEANIHTVH